MERDGDWNKCVGGKRKIKGRWTENKIEIGREGGGRESYCKKDDWIEKWEGLGGV